MWVLWVVVGVFGVLGVGAVIISLRRLDRHQARLRPLPRQPRQQQLYLHRRYPHLNRPRYLSLHHQRGP